MLFESAFGRRLTDGLTLKRLVVRIVQVYIVDGLNTMEDPDVLKFPLIYQHKGACSSLVHEEVII